MFIEPCDDCNVHNRHKILSTTIVIKLKENMEEIHRKLSRNPIINRKINRSDIVTNICTFLILSVAYQSMLSSFSTVDAQHMSDEDNGKQFNEQYIDVASIIINFLRYL